MDSMQRRYMPQEAFTVSTDLDGFVALLETYTSGVGLFDEVLKDAFVRRTRIGAKGSRIWKLAFEPTFTSHASYVRGVVFRVNQLSPLASAEPQLWVRAECSSNGRETVQFFDGLLGHIAHALGVAELSDRQQAMNAYLQQRPEEAERQENSNKGYLGAARLGEYDDAADRINNGEPACCVWSDWFEVHARTGRFASDKTARDTFHQQVKLRLNPGKELPRLSRPPCEHKAKG